MTYSPPFTLNNKIVSLVANISEQLGRFWATLAATQSVEQSLLLRKVNRVRTIQGSLAIEGNQLSEEPLCEVQNGAILDGKRVIAPAREVQEASNALTVSYPPSRPSSHPPSRSIVKCDGELCEAEKKAWYLHVRFCNNTN